MTLPYFTWPLGSTPDPEPPSVAYVARVQLHDIATWVVSNDPDFDPVFLPEDPIGLLADPLTITRNLPQSDLWPLQPEPATATFAVVTPTAADLDAVAIGSTVAITYHSPYVAFVAPTEAFYGRVADVQVTPGHYSVGKDPETGEPIVWGALHTITCVDYLADQADDQIRWGIPYYDLLVPTVPIPYLLADFFDQAGMGDLVLEEYDGEAEPDSPWVEVPDQDAETGALALIETLLAQWPLVGDARGPARYVLDQNIVASTGLPDADQPYRLRLAFKNLDPSVEDYLDAPDPDHLTVVDADHTDLTSTYSLRKFDGIRRVIVYPAPGYGLTRAVEELPGSPKPTVKIATAIDAQIWVDALAAFYLPGDAARNRYAADTFTWRLYAAPEGSFLPELGDPVAVDGINPDWTPTGLSWFTGRLTGYTLTIATKRPTVAFTLRDVAS